MSQQGLILVHTERLKPKGPISEKLVSTDISHVAFTSVLLRENPSEEVDDYYNYCYYKQQKKHLLVNEKRRCRDG